MDITSRPELPIVCTLTPAGQAERRHDLNSRLSSAVEERIELADGYALRFPPEGRWIRELAEVVALERDCCRFLTFELEAESEGGPIWLKLRGPQGTKEFLSRNLDFCAPA